MPRTKKERPGTPYRQPVEALTHLSHVAITANLSKNDLIVIAVNKLLREMGEPQSQVTSTEWRAIKKAEKAEETSRLVKTARAAFTKFSAERMPTRDQAEAYARVLHTQSYGNPKKTKKALDQLFSLLADTIDRKKLRPAEPRQRRMRKRRKIIG